jgi:putative spermidine/putrescine transport system permease protein
VHGLRRLDDRLDRGEGLTPLSGILQRRPGLRVGLLLTPPMLWLGVAYLGALGALFLTAFWGQNDFTGEIEKTWTLDNFRDLVTIDVYRTITLRTLAIAAGVTVVDALLALPIAFFMAKVASPRLQRVLVVAVLMPLWASYLVKAYAWRGMLSTGGLVDWVLNPFGLGSPGYGLPATVITLAYLWLPYMILPIYAGLERLPDSLLEASADLGGSAWMTIRRVVVPMAFPAIVAGAIFAFSLTLGDYIAVKIVGGTNQMLGNVVYDSVGAANNLPFGAAVATVPVVLMLLFLAAVRRTGALENL